MCRDNNYAIEIGWTPPKLREQSGLGCLSSKYFSSHVDDVAIHGIYLFVEFDSSNGCNFIAHMLVWGLTCNVICSVDVLANH